MMDFAANELHDATLTSIRMSWRDRTCVFDFAGAPSRPGPFSVEFDNVRELIVPSTMPWGHSASVLALAHVSGRWELQMQSGDVIAVVSSNNSPKVTPAGAPQLNP